MLKLTAMKVVENTHGDDVVEMQYEVVHNVAAHRTILTLPLSLKMNIETGAFVAAMEVGDVEAPGFDAALDKMATWCERAAWGIRQTTRKPGADLPLFERKAFDSGALPSWLKALYERTREDLLALPEGDESKAYWERLYAEHNPLIYIHDALECLRCEIGDLRDAAVSGGN
ncbi:hypothetical protein [Burkholderia vietnamiensis]|uniref:hypothetical protein n=1 Tax=Burkholderia vietnamiensis TaxID=60552 RepID=UPI001CF4BF34|nr:hypothetical protein [Burkholderia vietnamiensis]MCA8197288.1 hypothetical protein [Burkholderia vietnamiensis]